MKKILALLLALFTLPAMAQSVLTPITNGLVWTPAQWTTAWQGKQDYPATTAIPLFSWTTGGRPAAPSAGWIGYNSSLNQVEYWNGSAWVASSGGGSVNPGAQYSLPYYSASGSASTLSAVSSLGTSGQVLTSQGSSSPPHWTNSSACSAGGPNCVGWYNVVSYGADPTGSSDSTSAIISAKAAAHAAGGGDVYFPAGSYMISSTLTISENNITLIGDGPRSSYIFAATSFTAGDMLDFTGTFDQMKNLGAISVPTRSAGSGKGAIIYTVGFGDDFDNFAISGGLYGIVVGPGSIGHSFRHLWMTRDGWPVTTIGTAGILITGTDTSNWPQDIFFDQGEVGGYTTNMEINDVSGLYVKNLSLESNLAAMYGVSMNPTSPQQVYAAYFTNVISEVYATTTGYPWLFNGTGVIQEISLVGCHSAWGSNGIAFTNSNTSSVTVNGGDFIDAYAYGVYLSAGNHISINGITVVSASQAGSGAYPGIAIGGATSSVITGVTSYGTNQSYGAQIISGSNNTITNNIFTGNINSTVPDAGTSDIVCGNQPGVACGGSSGAVTSVTGSGSGISVSPTTGSVVVSNTGVTSLAAGNNMSVSGSTGGVTVSGSLNPTLTSVNTNNLVSNDGTKAVVTLSGVNIFLGNTYGDVTSNGAFLPGADNSFPLGATGFRWTTVYATTGTINTSDARDKISKGDEALGLPFIRKLHARAYEWKDQHNQEKHGVFHGFYAQEVEDALDGQDFAGLVKPEGPNGRYGLRYTEFIAPLAKGEQDLAKEVDDLKAQIAELKAAVSALSKTPIH